MLHKLYQKLILKYPLTILLILVSSILIFGINITKLEIDASAETLLLNDDKDLAFSRTVTKRFHTNDVLILAYKPNADLLSDESLQTLTQISEEIEKLPGVESVDSLISVPLFFSPIREMDDLINETRTLKSENIDLSLVKHELLTSPLYKDRLVNKAFTISSIFINLHQNPDYFTLLEKRNHLLELEKNKPLTKEEKQELQEVTIAFKEHRDAQRVLDNENIEEIRSIITKYQDKATFFLGGAQMISNDIIGFVKNDLHIKTGKSPHIKLALNGD